MLRSLCLLGLLTLLGACTNLPPSHAVETQLLLRTSSAWDGSPYTTYPIGQPELSVLKIRIAPDTTLNWHRHAMPNAGYLVQGELRVETPDGHHTCLRAGEALAEIVDGTHRGRAGSQGAELIVFYAGSPGMDFFERDSGHPEQDPQSPPR